MTKPFFTKYDFEADQVLQLAFGPETCARLANLKHEADCPYKIIWEEWVPKYGTALNYLGEAIELAELVCKDHWHSGVKNKARDFLKKVKK